MEDRWAKFMADSEWSDIRKETGARYAAVRKLVGRIGLEPITN